MMKPTIEQVRSYARHLGRTMAENTLANIRHHVDMYGGWGAHPEADRTEEFLMSDNALALPGDHARYITACWDGCWDVATPGEMHEEIASAYRDTIIGGR